MASVTERLAVRGIDLEVWRRGAGAPVVLLHDAHPVDCDASFVQRLAAHATIIAPSHRASVAHRSEGLRHGVRPRAPLPRGPRRTRIGCGHAHGVRVRRLARRRDRRGVSSSARATHPGRCSRDQGEGPDTPDILDVFNTSPAQVQRRSWHDVAAAPDFDAMSDDAIVAYARDREALCLYAWHPYMYNPQLAQWLWRIRVPTFVVWGASDGIVTPSYGRAYAARIPGARFEVIESAGHHPEIEQPEAFTDRVVGFLEGPCRPGS